MSPTSLSLFWTLSFACITAGFASSPPSVSLNYDIVNASPKPCPGRDSCNNDLLPRGSNRGPIEKIDWKKRNCFCDLDCSKYGDCCVDSEVGENPESAKEFSCINLKQYGNVYVKTTCPAKHVDSDVQSACEGTTESDPIGNTPVTSLSSGYTYKNYFCALCHGDSHSIRFWKSRLECPTITGYSDRFRNISKDFVEERLERRGGQWGLEIDTGGIGVFHRCQVDPAVPDELSSYIRSCPGQRLVQSCPSNYSNATISKYCMAYTGIVNVGSIKYKNSYCATCHNVSSEHMACYNLGPLGRFHWPKNFNTYSFAVLFDISGSGSVGKKCEAATQIYDPYFKKCRNVVCRSKNSEYVNGKCVEKTVVPPNDNDNDTTTTTTTTATTATKLVDESTTTTTTTTSTTTKTDKSTTTTTTSPQVATSTTLKASPEPNDSIPTSPSITTTTTTTTSSSTEETTFTTTYEDFDITTTVVETTEFLYYSSEDLINETSPPAVNHVTDQTMPEEMRMMNDSTSDEDFEVFFDCPKIVLSSDEFQVLPNNSIFIPKYSRVFDEENFDSSNDSIIICLPDDEDANKNSEYYSKESETKFGYYMSYISLACLSISIVCLTLHILASIISPELQNLNGKNLLSLSLSLLGGYSSFIAGMFLSNDGIGCRILGLVMYFFFLASFVWMFIISFDVCRSLMRSISELRVMGGSQWKKYFLYSLFGWSVPLSCGAIAAFADFDVNHANSPWLIKPGFGEAGLCWFSSKQALLLYFALPFGIIASGNLGFFIWSAFLVYNTTKDVAIRRLNYHLYLKLGVLMGLTWIVGLVAGFLDFEILWIIFIVLNTLQGLFIFLAFTCTKKVVKSLKNSLPSSTESFMFPSSSHSTSRYPPAKHYQGTRSNNKTMYMVQPPKHDSMPTSNSFNKRYY